ncbi:DUF3108 domain-containing protein [Faunimonas sp. B44]|uniref:DUF3108 domain-containing protein n=1 Tax=Faunimonas sp. B44 TaxID=3461493 RepID=UPI004044B9FD
MLALCSHAAAAATIEARYNASLIGLPVGSASLRIETDGSAYRIAGQGGVGGLSRLLSNARSSISAAGAIPGPAPSPVSYRQAITTGDESETVTISFSRDAIAAASIEPDRPRHRRNRVPLSDGDLRSVLDPASAIVVPLNGASGPEICERTVPVFDGRQRFDIVLSYSRTETVRSVDGYAGPAQVCAIRYVPIAGHRANRRTIKQLAENRDMEIWLAPIAPAGLALPVRLRVATGMGPLVLRAERIALQ